MRAVMLVPMLAGGRRDRRDQPRQRRVRAHVHARRPRVGRGARAAARAPRSRTRACTASARTSPRRSSAGCCPDELPTIPGLRLASLYRPAGEENLVGGDFYDAFATAAGWMLLVGDVTGRGADAAARTGQARHTLRTAGLLLGDPVRCVGAAQPRADRRARADAVHGRDRPCHRVGPRTCCAPAIPQPLLLRDGVARAVGPLRPDAGAWPDAWRADPIELVDGDVLVLYTDGVTDARGETGASATRACSRRCAAPPPRPSAVSAIDRALTKFQRGSQADDTAILALDLPPVGA